MKVIITLLILSYTGYSQLIPERLTIVDQNFSNYIVRGNLPIKNKLFQIDQLKQSLENITHLEKNSYQLVVISLMNGLTPKQTINMYIQQKFFDHHKEYTYINNIVLGSLIDPKKVPRLLRNSISRFYEHLSIDGMDKLVDTLSQYLKNKKPTIVYFHCSQGVDRTGYVHAAYSMKYENKSLEEAYQFNLNILKNMRSKMHWNTYLGIEWYCLYLGRTESECLKALQD